MPHAIMLNARCSATLDVRLEHARVCMELPSRPGPNHCTAAVCQHMPVHCVTVPTCMQNCCGQGSAGERAQCGRALLECQGRRGPHSFPAHAARHRAQCVCPGLGGGQPFNQAPLRDLHGRYLHANCCSCWTVDSFAAQPAAPVMSDSMLTIMAGACLCPAVPAELPPSLR